MPPLRTRKYSDDQREAVATAHLDRGLKAAAIVKQAAAGELTLNGEPLPPFEMNPGSVATYSRALSKKRRGRDTGEMAELPPRDAIEVLRRRLVQLADRETLELRAKKTGTLDTERLRQIARAVKEIAAIPGPTEPRPAAPGASVNGQHQGGQTRGGAAGALLRDHRAEHGKGQARGEPEPTTSTPPHTQRDTQDARTQDAQHQPNAEPDEADQHDTEPGASSHALGAWIAETPGG